MATTETDGDVLARLGADPAKWAEEFVKRFGDCDPRIDFGLMVGWFSNAIGAAELAAERADAESQTELAFLAAGVGSGAVMRLAPHVVMPTEDITRDLQSLLAERGINLAEIPGFRGAVADG